MERHRAALVLCREYLGAHGFTETGEALRKEAGAALEKVRVVRGGARARARAIERVSFPRPALAPV